MVCASNFFLGRHERVRMEVLAIIPVIKKTTEIKHAGQKTAKRASLGCVAKEGSVGGRVCACVILK